MPNCLSFCRQRLCLGTSAAHAQYTAKEWPEGPGKQRFVDTCNNCHDINRVRGGYTPEGWLTVVRMMQNMDAPVPADEWGTVTDYLMKNFPERKRPEAVLVDGPAKVDFKMWDVPTQGSRPHDPLAARDGSIWWSGTTRQQARPGRSEDRRDQGISRSSRRSPARTGWSTTRTAISGLPETRRS